MKLSDLQTPALILDRGRLIRNLRRMTQRAAERGVRLRPHLKTAKSIEVARLALEGNFGGITVSTLREAEYFAAHGIDDILYAVAIVPSKLERAAALQARGVKVTLVCDDAIVASAIGERARALGTRFDVLIELDTGEGRSGVLPHATSLVAIGRVLHESEGTELAGVMTHAGHSYACRTLGAIEEVAEQERAGAVAAAQRLREAGLPCPTVSVGSTPTALYGRSAAGLTELRAGVYMFGDVFQAEIGSCSIDDLAVSVLASVIGHRADRNSLLIDAGALALSKDRSTEALPLDAGFGLLAREDGSLLEGLRVERVYQEHGLVAPLDGGPLPCDELPVGARVRVLPNHVCMTAAMYDRYYVVDDGDEILALWPRTNGWEPLTDGA